MFSVRAATVADATAIAHVHRQSWLTTYAGIVPDEYLAGLNATARVLQWQEWLPCDVEVYVAEFHGERPSKIAGFVAGGPIREPLQDCDAEPFAIYLLEGAQRRGIGTALVRRLVRSLKDKGFKSMAVWVLDKNPSVNFYQKLGAVRSISKEVEIGGKSLPEVAYVWPDLEAFR